MNRLGRIFLDLGRLPNRYSEELAKWRVNEHQVFTCLYNDATFATKYLWNNKQTNAKFRNDLKAGSSLMYQDVMCLLFLCAVFIILPYIFVLINLAFQLKFYAILSRDHMKVHCTQCVGFISTTHSLRSDSYILIP
jgi:hypothetical protein